MFDTHNSIYALPTGEIIIIRVWHSRELRSE